MDESAKGIALKSHTERLLGQIFDHTADLYRCLMASVITISVILLAYALGAVITARICGRLPELAGALHTPQPMRTAVVWPALQLRRAGALIGQGLKLPNFDNSAVDSDPYMHM